MILGRFGPTPARMVRCLERYVAITDAYGVTPTLPLTARVLERNAPTIRSFVDRGVEFAVHGLVHDDHKIRSLEEQRRSISAAMAIFDVAGVPHSGFRAPYLRYNAATELALRELQVSYHSSQAVFFPVVALDMAEPRINAYQRVLALYGALDAERSVVRPRLDAGLVHIPVALPDDESMIERLRLGPESRVSIWTAILARSYHRSELFTLQLHPERAFELDDALEAVLADARRRRPAIWIARLDEIADWWRRRARARLRVDSVGAGRHRVHLEADPDATMLVRGLPTAGDRPWDDVTHVARSRDFEVASALKPVVGVSTRTSNDVIRLLRDEYIPCERSSDPAAYGAYLDLPGDTWSEAGVLERIAASAGPLVWLSRWPNAAKSALAITGDIDSVTLQDFAWRVWETRRANSARASKSDMHV